MKQIIFIFNHGRSKRLKSDANGPKEFFYTFNYFKRDNRNVDLLEANTNSSYLFKYVFKILRKISKLPIFSENFFQFKKINKILKSDQIISTNQNLSFSILPILVIRKLFSNFELYTFAMGLLELSNQKVINKIMINIFYNLSHKVIFISKNEFNQACISFPNFKHKFIYIPFGVDQQYWKLEDPKIKNKELLFIGNDSNRDFDFLLKLATKMVDFKFTIITERLKDIDLPNVRLINGNWNKQILEDDEIKKFYNKSFLTLLPLKNSFQPSGQSVCLQSLSMETPVIITKTQGFWDSENFRNNENIFFCNENDIDEWVEKIKDIYEGNHDYLEISKKGRELIEEKFNLDKMYNLVSDLVN